jgi:hypothetical protein
MNPRTKILEGNLLAPSPIPVKPNGGSPNKELTLALKDMFKGFSFYSDPEEEKEV